MIHISTVLIHHMVIVSMYTFYEGISMTQLRCCSGNVSHHDIIHDISSWLGFIISLLEATDREQGLYGSWKTWKVLEFYCGIFQDWKVLEKVKTRQDKTRQDKTRQLYLTRVAQSAAKLVSLGALGLESSGICESSYGNFNYMWSLKFKAQLANASLATVNQIFSGSFQLSTTAEHCFLV